MEMSAQPRKSPFKRVGILLTAAAVVLAFGLAIPSYRPIFLVVLIFLGISVAIGVAVALILHFWHRFKPVSEKSVENKRPLGLD